MVTIVTCIVIAASGCTENNKQELAYRDTFKKNWDETMTTSNKAKQTIDASYAAGDVATVVAQYRLLEKQYNDLAKETEKEKTPEGYDKLKRSAVSYYRQGATYYRDVAKVIEDTGGNYGGEQEEALKEQEEKWQQATDSLETELKKKRFEML